MRQQELESIKTANELGLYSKSALKAWMDKHLAKTFAAGKDAEVIDLTSDDGTNTDTTNSPDSTTVSTNNNSTPNDNTRVRLFTDDDNEEEENQKPSAGVTNNNGTNTHSTYANEQQQTYYSSFTGSYDVNTFGDAKYNTKKSQPTLTQGGMGYVIPQRSGTSVEQNGEGAPLASEVAFLNEGVCCSGGHCTRPSDVRGVQCTVCLGMTHLECCTSMFDGSVQCNGCYALGGKPV